MSAVISNSNPGAYIREMADMEHDIVRTVEQADAVAAPVLDKLPTLDAIWREMMTLRDKRKAEERQLARLTEEVAMLTREQRETEAYIGELRGKESALIERLTAEARS